MRLALVFSLSLVACGGSIEANEASPGGVASRPELPAAELASPCGASRVVAKTRDDARAVTASGFTFGWLEGDGAFVVLAGRDKHVAANGVTSLAGSQTMFAFTMSDGGVGTYQDSTILYPGAGADGVAPGLTDLTWRTHDGSLLRGAIGESHEIAYATLPIFAVDGESTWFTTAGFAPDSVTVHHDDAIVATDVRGVPTKMFAAGERAWLGFADRVITVAPGEPVPVEVWQGGFVDFAADAREVVVATHHALERMSGSSTKEVSLGECTVRSMTMDAQTIVALVGSEHGSLLVSVSR